MQKRHIVLPIIRKTAGVSFVNTMLLAIPVVLFPKVTLYPLLGGTDMSLIDATQPILLVLLLILALFSMGAIFFNGLAGTGATLYGLKLQIVGTILYAIYVYVVIKYFDASLAWAWASEIVYWVWTFALTNWYLRSRHWYGLEM
jgi:Na+-driven multidrug efflux pump